MHSTYYLQRLTWAARWRLPAAEAGEVVSDYAELLEGDRRTYEEQCRALGTPRDAVRLLSTGWTYRRWLAVFAALALCLLLPLLWMYGLSYRYQLSRGAYLFFLLPGVVLSLIWFRWMGGKSGTVPRRLPVLLGLTALLGLLVALMAVPAFSPRLLEPLASVIPARWLGRVYHLALCTIGLLAAAAGLAGLVLARLEDRRWISLYVLGLTVLLLAFVLYSLLSSMDLSALNEDWQGPYRMRMVQAGILGLAGTGVSLC